MGMVTKLIVATGKSAGRSIAIKRNKLLIGRAEECDVRPLSEEVSRRHCAVIVGPADVWVQDLGSRNGTYVNGDRIEAKTKLADGDLIRVGSLELKVSCSAPAAPKPEADDDVSRWLMDDDAGTSDTTRSLSATAESTDGSFIGGMVTSAPEPADASGGPSGSDAAGGSSSGTTLAELKALKDKPGTLPAASAAAKKSDSSRDAAAEALKKFFDRK
jgi:pSer/pThr/pTyr-binding forkhead associated (FHA) protein